MKRLNLLNSLVFAAAFVLVAGSRSLAAPDDTANGSMLIQPRVAMGPITNGMTMDQVAAAMGQPDDKTGHVFNYEHLGFSVIPNKAGMVRVIMAGEPNGFETGLADKFKGKTKEGIGTHSSRSEVIAAFGQPPRIDKANDLETLVYPSLGLSFTLDGGKVCHIIIDFRKNG